MLFFKEPALCRKGGPGLQLGYVFPVGQALAARGWGADDNILREKDAYRNGYSIRWISPIETKARFRWAERRPLRITQ